MQTIGQLKGQCSNLYLETFRRHHYAWTPSVTRIIIIIKGSQIKKYILMHMQLCVQYFQTLVLQEVLTVYVYRTHLRSLNAVAFLVIINCMFIMLC